jgi:hypothetical protein
MAFNTVINLDVARLSDGFYLVGGSDRKLQLSDINIEMTGTQDLQVAFPNFAACTLLAMEEYTAKGDILAATGANVPVPLSVGTNGQVLTANSAQATGLEWKTIETISYSTITTNTTAVAGTAYIVGQAASQIEITLPATAAVGSVVKVYGISSNLWTILQNAGSISWESIRLLELVDLSTLQLNTMRSSLFALLLTTNGSLSMLAVTSVSFNH